MPPAHWLQGLWLGEASQGVGSGFEQDVSGDGEWRSVLVDTVDLRVTSEDPVTVRLIPNYARDWVMYGLVAFLVWIVGILLFATMI